MGLCFVSSYWYMATSSNLKDAQRLCSEFWNHYRVSYKAFHPFTQSTEMIWCFFLSFFWFSFWWSSNDVIAMMSVFRILHCSRLPTRLHWRGISVLNIQNWQILMSMIWTVNQCSARKLFSRDPALLTQVEFDWHFITGCTSFKLETVLGRFSIR